MTSRKIYFVVEHNMIKPRKDAPNDAITAFTRYVDAESYFDCIMKRGLRSTLFEVSLPDTVASDDPLPKELYVVASRDVFEHDDSMPRYGIDVYMTADEAKRAYDFAVRDLYLNEFEPDDRDAGLTSQERNEKLRDSRSEWFDQLTVTLEN